MAGLNTEIEHNNSSFHVQTQDLDSGANYIESTIYKSGRFISSRKSIYTSYLNHPDLAAKIVHIIEEQHNKIISEIKEGKYDRL